MNDTVEHLAAPAPAPAEEWHAPCAKCEGRHTRRGEWNNGQLANWHCDDCGHTTVSLADNPRAQLTPTEKANLLTASRQEAHNQALATLAAAAYDERATIVSQAQATRDNAIATLADAMRDDPFWAAAIDYAIAGRILASHHLDELAALTGSTRRTDSLGDLTPGPDLADALAAAVEQAATTTLTGWTIDIRGLRNRLDGLASQASGYDRRGVPVAE